MTCVIAWGPFKEEGAEALLRETLLAHEFTVTGSGVLIVECEWKDVPWLASLVVDVPFIAHSPNCPVETKNALTAYWTRKQNPIWHANEDWFQAHKHEFKRDELVVVRECEVKLRTVDRRECMDFLVKSPEPNTVFHEMSGDGEEIILRL